eukprot:295811_1
MDQQWNCSLCTYSNVSTASNCEMCGNKNEIIISDEWSCSACTFLNKSNASKCSMCNQEKSVKTLLHSNVEKDKIRVDKVKFILNVYDNWISLKQTNDIEYDIGIYDIINSCLSDKYDFCDFLNDYNFVVDNK